MKLKRKVTAKPLTTKKKAAPKKTTIEAPAGSADDFVADGITYAAKGECLRQDLATCPGNSGVPSAYMYQQGCRGGACVWANKVYYRSWYEKKEIAAAKAERAAKKAEAEKAKRAATKKKLKR